MLFIENSMIYWEKIRQLRNEEIVKSGFIHQHEISPEEHEKHMNRFCECYYICVETEQRDLDSLHNFLGYCGVINDDIRVAVLPEHHGKGVGTFMINELVKRRPRAFARVKIDNEASLNLFKKCGFKKKYYILERE